MVRVENVPAGPGSTAATVTSDSAPRRTRYRSTRVRCHGAATRLLTKPSEGKSAALSRQSRLGGYLRENHSIQPLASAPTFGEVVIHYDPEPVSSHRVDMLLGVGPRRPRAPRERSARDGPA